MARISRADAQKLVGKPIYAVRKDGSVATGKLVRILGNKLLLELPRNKKVHTKAIIPLALFDILAIGTLGGFGGFGGFGGYGYNGYGYGGYGGYGGFGGGWF